MADKLIEFMQANELNIIGRFKIELTDDPRDPLQLTLLPPIDITQLKLWEEQL